MDEDSTPRPTQLRAWDSTLVRLLTRRPHSQVKPLMPTTITRNAPGDLDVRQVGRNGPLDDTLEPPIPCIPVVRLNDACDVGETRVMHAAETEQDRRRSRRRSSRTAARP